MGSTRRDNRPGTSDREVGREHWPGSLTGIVIWETGSASGDIGVGFMMRTLFAEYRNIKNQSISTKALHGHRYPMPH